MLKTLLRLLFIRVVVVVVVAAAAAAAMILLNGYEPQDVFIKSQQTRSCFSSFQADFGLFLQTGHDRLPVYNWPLPNHL
jgi:hypothetical protein